MLMSYVIQSRYIRKKELTFVSFYHKTLEQKGGYNKVTEKFLIVMNQVLVPLCKVW